MTRQRHRSGSKQREQTKARLVAVLAFVFAGVIYVQFFPQNASTEPTVTPEQSQRPVVTPVSFAAVPSVCELTLTPEGYPRLALQRRTIEEICNFSPYVSRSDNRNGDTANALDGEPMVVNAVYLSSGRASALVGDGIVRRGERLPDGQQMVTATAKGIVAGPFPPTQ